MKVAAFAFPAQAKVTVNANIMVLLIVLFIVLSLLKRISTYGSAVPDLARTRVVSPLLTKPSMFTSERKLVASLA